MSRRAVVAVVTLSLAAGCRTLQTIPPTAPTDWDRLRVLQPDSELRLVLRSGEHPVVRLVSVSDRQLEVKVACGFCATRNRLYTPDDLDGVYVRGKRHAKAGAQVGALIGLGASVVLVASGLMRAEPADQFAVLFAAFGTGWGAAIGALSGYSRRDETLVWTRVPVAATTARE